MTKEVYHVPVDMLAPITEAKNVTTKEYVDTGLAGKAAASVATTLNTHTANKANPHGVTAAQIGAATTAIATKTANGLMSAADKAKLDGVTSNSLMKVFTTTITGNGTAKEWTITHNIGTTNVIVQALDAAGNVCIFGVTKVSGTQVKLTAAVAPATGNTYSVLVMGTGA